MKEDNEASFRILGFEVQIHRHTCQGNCGSFGSKAEQPIQINRESGQRRGGHLGGVFRYMGRKDSYTRQRQFF